MSRTKYWSRRSVPWSAVLAGLLLLVFVTAVLALVTSVNIDSPTQTTPVYKKQGDSFAVKYGVEGSAENVDVKIYLGGVQVYSENVPLPVVEFREVNPNVPNPTADGKYDLKVEATGSSVKFKTELEAVIVDNTRPAVLITDIPACVGNLTSIGGTASDAAPGVVDKVYVKIKNTTETKWWNGAGWVGTDPTWILEATDTTSWTYPAGGGLSFDNGKSYQVWAKAQDKAGNETAAPPTDTFTVDTAKPTVDITTPPTGDQNSVPSLAGTASDIGCAGMSNVQVQVYNVTGARYWKGSTGQWVATEAWNNYTGGTLANWTYTMPTLTSGRQYQVDAKAIDAGGNFDTDGDGPFAFDYDDVNPTVDITTPDPDTEYYQAMDTFAGQADDDSSGVDKVEVKLQRLSDNEWWDDSVPGWVVTETLLLADVTALPTWTYDASAPAVTYGDGLTYEVSAKATDFAGNNPGVSDQFTIDITAPAATITGIADEVGCSFVEIAGTASDATSDLDIVEVSIQRAWDSLYWNGATPGWEAGAVWNEATGMDIWTYDVSGVTFDDGDDYDVLARATDNVGLVTAGGDQPTGTFTYDECPEVAITAPTGGAILNTLAQFSGTADDDGDGSVQNVQVKIERGVVLVQNWTDATDTNPGGDWSTWKYVYAFSVDGEYTLSARSLDDFGQWSVEEEISFTFDATAPSAMIYSIPDPSEPQEISGTASDGSGSGLASVEVKVEREDGRCWDSSLADGWSLSDENWDEPFGGTLADWTFTHDEDLTDTGTNFAFATGKVYTVTVKATDLAVAANVTAEDDQDSKTFTYGTDGPSKNLNLGDGWNLMSLPLIPNDTNITAVLADLLATNKVDWVTTFVWQGGVLVEKKYDPDPYLPQLTTMTTGPGYWVKMFSDGILVNAGNYQPDPPQVPKSYQVYPGWNLIGYHTTDSDRLGGAAVELQSYLGDTVAAQVRAAYWYDNENSLYMIQALDDDMGVGLGYWVALDTGGTVYPRMPQ